MAENENLDYFLEYCKIWKLNINYSKTKVLIFGARNTDRFKFVLDGEIIEVVDKFKNLGVYFSRSKSFLKAKKHVLEQARSAPKFTL